MGVALVLAGLIGFVIAIALIKGTKKRIENAPPKNSAPKSPSSMKREVITFQEAQAKLRHIEQTMPEGLGRDNEAKTLNSYDCIVDGVLSKKKYDPTRQEWDIEIQLAYDYVGFGGYAESTYLIKACLKLSEEPVRLSAAIENIKIGESIGIKGNLYVSVLGEEKRKRGHYYTVRINNGSSPAFLMIGDEHYSFK